MNISVPIENSLEFIEVTPVSPLISKCQIKVCYVQDEPNRNGSVITKETAKEMANTLPGCPIVGFYNESNEDFEGHNQTIKVGNGEVEVKDTTIPYGFVDMNPRVWFQQFADGPNHEIHEYLMTEGYIWSGQFPEAKRILTKGNNQSMELDDRFIDGKWAESEDGYYSFFIINDAVISKLCVLGEDVEPCFEGAQIKAQFSLDDFSQRFKTMAYELKQILGEGGQEMEEIVQNEEMIQEEPVIEEEFANENEVVEEIVDTVVESTEDENFKKNDGQKEEKEDSQKADEDEEDYKKKRKCSLENEEEVVDYAKEYVDLYKKFTELTEKYNKVVEDLEKVQKLNDSLTEFKAKIELEEKQNMIDSFYMLSDEDKKEVKENINSYSVDDIEAKLAVMCVRKKVNFEKSVEEKEEEVLSYNTNFSLDDSAPEWLKSVQEHKNK